MLNATPNEEKGAEKPGIIHKGRETVADDLETRGRANQVGGAVEVAIGVGAAAVTKDLSHLDNVVHGVKHIATGYGQRRAGEAIRPEAKPEKKAA